MVLSVHLITKYINVYFALYTVRQKKLHRFIFAIALSELHLL